AGEAVGGGDSPPGATLEQLAPPPLRWACDGPSRRWLPRYPGSIDSLPFTPIYGLLCAGPHGSRFHVEHHFRRRLELDVVVRRPPRPRCGPCFHRVIDTTVAGSAKVPEPQVTTRMFRAPYDRIASRSRATSSVALAPFMARTSPPGRANGRHHSENRASGANARPVTTSNLPHRSCTTRSSARPRTTCTGS